MTTILLRFELSSVAFFLVGPFQFLVGLCISSDWPRSRDPPCPRRARGTSGTTASPDAAMTSCCLSASSRASSSSVLLVTILDMFPYKKDRIVYSYYFFGIVLVCRHAVWKCAMNMLYIYWEQKLLDPNECRIVGSQWISTVLLEHVVGICKGNENSVICFSTWFFCQLFICRSCYFIFFIIIWSDSAPLSEDEARCLFPLS